MRRESGGPLSGPELQALRAMGEWELLRAGWTDRFASTFEEVLRGVHEPPAGVSAAERRLLRRLVPHFLSGRLGGRSIRTSWVPQWARVAWWYAGAGGLVRVAGCSRAQAALTEVLRAGGLVGAEQPFRGGLYELEGGVAPLAAFMRALLDDLGAP